VAHAAPAWRVTGLWEDVPPVRVGGYLLDGGISLVGRDPDPLEGEVVDNLMVVPDGAVSKTHLSVRLSATALHAIDRGSRNGTTLVHADGTTEKLQPWVEIELPEGAALRIGSSLLERDAPWEDDEDDVGRTMLR
jgi:pSer/pThr/pTyr-binding forkhead associated (FHA) protein